MQKFFYFNDTQKQLFIVYKKKNDIMKKNAQNSNNKNLFR